jgi:hypothetical protein
MINNAAANSYGITSFNSIKNVLIWWSTHQRFIFFYAISITARCVTPFLRLFFILLVKWYVIGTFVPMDNKDKESTPWLAMKYSLMKDLMSGGDLAGVAKLVGTHYDIISVIYRYRVDLPTVLVYY